MPRPALDSGSPEPLGVSQVGNGVNVAVFSANASAIEFCLFDAAGEREVRRVGLPERTGDIFHGFIGDVPAGSRYGLRGHGVFAPSEGHRFNPSKLLIDPYARAIDRPFKLHSSMFGTTPDGALNSEDSAPAMPKAVFLPPLSPLTPRMLVPWDKTVLYELHVRGFTMRREAIPAALRGTFGGLAHPASIEYLVKLGVTSVEIMPAAAWIEERHLAVLGLTNYWGYNTAAFMTPDPRLAPGGWEEVRATVAVLAEAGIETIADIVLNHTAEGNANGPTLSMRGLDNASYYRLPADHPAEYVDDAGCGNVLALDRPHVVRLAMDALRAWAELGGVHGFRFDLAPVLGRRADGFDPGAPLLTAISQDPVLRELKLIAEPWDVGAGGYKVGGFPAGWAEWNDRFRDDTRRFWRGDAMGLGDIATRLAGSSDLFQPKNRPSRGVNFIVAHDGFTLSDLVSFDRKANFANGEENRDGTDENRSWNNGVEGPSDDPAVLAARIRDQRALLALLLLSRGTPMLAMGSELGHSQSGNNNAYAQDNETSWIDWTKTDQALRDWTARLIAIRRGHAAFRQDRFLTGQPTDGGSLPDVEWFGDGWPMDIAGWNDPHGPALVMVLSGAGDKGPDRAALAINRGATPVTITLPEIRTGYGWYLLADSSEDRTPVEIAGPTTVPGRAILVLAEVPSAPGKIRGGKANSLDRLAQAAGIALKWEGADYSSHIVGDDAKRALLKALDLPAGSEREAVETLGRLAEERDRRPLPYALTIWSGDPVAIDMPLARGFVRRPVTLVVTLEGGETQPVRFAPEDGKIAAGIAADSREHRVWRVILPNLPAGRHRVYREDMPDIGCWLTIAPRRAHLPGPLKNGGRAFGIATQLYATRGRADQGIGDFTVLGDLAAEAARQDASLVVINPLHALFAAERGRASPYQPSDRRFLDPIYIDVAGLGEAGIGRAHDLYTTHAGAFAAQSAASDVGYRAVWGLKQQVLERRFADFESLILAQPENEEAQAFERFIAAGGNTLERFAIFEAISETLPSDPWMRWPGGLAEAYGVEVESFAWAHRPRVRFHQYLQYLCDLQLGAAAARAKSVGLELGLMRDLAIGAAPDGAEVWTQPDMFIKGVSVGAPPDPLATTGQIWGLPPINPHSLIRSGFGAFATLLAANMRHAGGLRIDHAMGLTRLFWVPDGAEGKDGAYVAYPFKDMLGQVTLESTRAECLVVGEDLGTVPNGFREPLAEADIQSYRVLFLERDGLGFNRPAVYAQNALSCISTHDLPTFAGWWEGADLKERASLGIIEPETLGAALTAREQEKAALVAALVDQELLDDPGKAMLTAEDVMPAAHAYVAGAPSTLVVAQTDDLAGERVAVNLPGTSNERPNWRRKIATPVPDLLNSAGAQAILETLRKERPRRDVNQPIERAIERETGETP